MWGKLSFCTRDTSGLEKNNNLNSSLPFGQAAQSQNFTCSGKVFAICLVAKSTCPGQLDSNFLKPSTVRGRIKVHVGV